MTSTPTTKKFTYLGSTYKHNGLTLGVVRYGSLYVAGVISGDGSTLTFSMIPNVPCDLDPTVVQDNLDWWAKHNRLSAA